MNAYAKPNNGICLTRLASGIQVYAATISYADLAALGFFVLTPSMLSPISPASDFYVQVLVLAAGHGHRFLESGGQRHKLQALLHGKPVLEHVLDAVKEAGLLAYVVEPKDGLAKGIGDSIAYGVQQTAEAYGWLILPGDMPLIQAKTLKTIAGYLMSHPEIDAVQPVWRRQPGHPVAFSSRCAKELRALQGDVGARAVLKQLSNQKKVHWIEVEDQGTVHDIDTMADLKSAHQIFAQREEG